MKLSRAKKRRRWEWILGSKAAAKDLIDRLVARREARRRDPSSYALAFPVKP